MQHVLELDRQRFLEGLGLARNVFAAHRLLHQRLKLLHLPLGQALEHLRELGHLRGVHLIGAEPAGAPPGTRQIRHRPWRAKPRRRGDAMAAFVFFAAAAGAGLVSADIGGGGVSHVQGFIEAFRRCHA